MLWLCVRFPQLPLEVFATPGAQDGPPAAVSEQHRVLCANAAATRLGITPGMSTGTAQALAAELRLREREPAREAALLLSLADWGHAFTSRVATAPPAGLLLEIGASLRLFGGLEALLGCAARELHDRGHAARLGLAPTPLAAELFARAAPCTPSSPPAWCDPPDGAGFMARLGGLPIAALEAPERQQLAMQRMGFTQLGELLALPRPALGRRFGKAFLDYLLRLCGDRPDPRHPHPPRERFAAELHFLEPVGDAAMLLFPMRRLLDDLGRFLERRQLHCQRLEWRMHGRHAAPVVLPLACSLEQHRGTALLELTRLALERLRLPGPVDTLELRCLEASAVRGRSEDLFDDALQGGPDAERLLLDRLRLRLGEERLHGLHVADAHLPEEAWSRVREPSPLPGAAPWMQRPCWLLPEPAPLGGSPEAPRWQGPLELLAGPERIDAAWWAAPQRRDYYIARQADGVVAWVFRERASRRWFVQGVFG